ncbi:MAG: diguanylate cyclase domain-containing protein [Acidiferrobacterales bacterium]
MLTRHFTMRTTLGLTIGLMGLLGLALALTTGEFYRRVALDNQRALLAQLMSRTVSDRLNQINAGVRDLGLMARRDRAFDLALRHRDPAAVTRQLEKLRNRKITSDAAIEHSQLVFFDEKLKTVGTSNGIGPVVSRIQAGCPELLEQAGRRHGAQRRQTISAMCLADHQPRYAVLAPIAGSRVDGYIEVVCHPAVIILSLEARLGLPVELRAGARDVLYRSPDWPAPEALANTLMASYTLSAPDGTRILTISALNNVRRLNERLDGARFLVIAIAGSVTLLGVLFAFIVLDKSALTPLQNLALQLRRLQKDKSHLGEQVVTGGIAEIRELARDFNVMTLELKRLYGTLEHMAFTDPLTRLPNRVLFHDILHEFTRLNAETKHPFALLLMDLDRFKSVNDRFGHHVGDQLLREVSMRLRGGLRESDMITRLDDHTIARLDGKMVARLGGDEFAAILPNLGSAEDASVVARKLLAVMQKPFFIDGHRLDVGISIGIAIYPEHGSDNDTLLRRADSAMYRAKYNQAGFALHEPIQDQASLV